MGPRVEKKVKDSIAKLEKMRESKVIVYITGDRNPPNLFATQVAPDILDLLFLHLKSIGKTKKISLLLHTSGGLINAPWPIVNLIRAYCKEFEVLVPVKALSAGTLICLGANKIVMTSRSALSPIDPKSTFQIEGKPVNVEIEDVMGYLKFVKEKVGLKDQQYLVEALKELTAKVPPQVLGSIERAHAFVRKLSQDLLKLTNMDDKKVNEIVQKLTQDLFSHQHLIFRDEAKSSIGMTNIESIDGRKSIILNNCFNNYVDELELDTIFDPEKLLTDKGYKPNASPVKYECARAIIESSRNVNRFITELQISKDPNNQIKIEQRFLGWR